MNLYLRLIWVVVVSLFRKRIAVTERLSLSLRILPNDLDINNHVNNGRYLALLDLASVQLFIRSGLAGYMWKNRFRPVIGGVTITYRKGLKLFEHAMLSIQLHAWDSRWNYFRFEFRNAKGELAAAGFFKGAFYSRQGLYPNSEIVRLFGIGDVQDLLPPAIAHWIASEKAALA